MYHWNVISAISSKCKHNKNKINKKKKVNLTHRKGKQLQIKRTVNNK